MAQTVYECNACSYTIAVAPDARAPAMCPVCRSRMSPAGQGDPQPGTDYECGQCQYRFRVPQGGDPAYKCAACNFTFPSEPNKRVDHKL